MRDKKNYRVTCASRLNFNLTMQSDYRNHHPAAVYCVCRRVREKAVFFCWKYYMDEQYNRNNIIMYGIKTPRSNKKIKKKNTNYLIHIII